MSLEKSNPIRSRAIRKSAKGEACTMGSPQCNGDSKTVCWRHSNMGMHGKGRSLKAHDVFGFYGCQRCEDWYSGDAPVNDKIWYLMRAMGTSWLRLIEKGVVVVK